MTSMSPASVTAQWLAIPAVVHADLSPDGRRLVVTTAHVPVGSVDEVVNLRVIDLASGDVAPLPAAGDGDHTAMWSPDGSQLVFVTGRTGSAQLAVCAAGAGDGDVLAVTSLPGGAVGPAAWSPDGRRVVVAGRRGRSIDRTQPWRITRAVQWGDGIGHLDDPPQLWLCELDGGAQEMITDDEWRWSLPRWSPDGKTIAARVSFDPSGDRRGQHLRLVDTDRRWVAPAVPGGSAVVPAWASDGSLVVLSFQPEGQAVGSEGQLHRLMTDGQVQRLDASSPSSVGGTVYGDSPAAVGDAFESALLVHGMDVYVRTQRGGRMGVARWSLETGGWTEMVVGDRCASPLGMGATGLVIAEQSADRPCRLTVVPPGEGERWTSLSVTGGDEAPMPAVAHRFTVSSPHDGALLDAWHLRPAGVDGPLPSVVLIHGGPNAAFGECFQLDAQALCAAGFGVLFTNPHGSTGYGDEFTHAAINHWGDIPSVDVLAVLDEAVARGWVDGDRVAVAGNSYGGYLSTWLACTTDRFVAVVAENPAIDLLSMFGSSDIGATFMPMQMGCTPLEDIAPYLQWSPLLKARGCRTPMLFVVGGEDRRCPSSQAFEMHRTLRSLGQVSEVLVLPDSSHEGSTYGPPAVRLAHDAALVDWVDRWVGLRA